jgi:hypothetical protein
MWFALLALLKIKLVVGDYKQSREEGEANRSLIGVEVELISCKVESKLSLSLAWRGFDLLVLIGVPPLVRHCGPVFVF